MSSFSDILLKRIEVERSKVIQQVSEGQSLTPQERDRHVARNLALKWVTVQIEEIRKMNDEEVSIEETSHDDAQEEAPQPRNARRPRVRRPGRWG